MKWNSCVVKYKEYTCKEQSVKCFCPIHSDIKTHIVHYSRSKNGVCVAGKNNQAISENSPECLRIFCTTHR